MRNLNPLKKQKNMEYKKFLESKKFKLFKEPEDNHTEVLFLKENLIGNSKLLMGLPMKDGIQRITSTDGKLFSKKVKNIMVRRSYLVSG